MLRLVHLVALRSGHQSFSNNRSLNDLVGNIVHSSIMVPYHGKLELFSCCFCLASETLMLHGTHSGSLCWGAG